jgi:hypothetical protein
MNPFQSLSEARQLSGIPTETTIIDFVFLLPGGWFDIPSTRSGRGRSQGGSKGRIGLARASQRSSKPCQLMHCNRRQCFPALFEGVASLVAHIRTGTAQLKSSATLKSSITPSIATSLATSLARAILKFSANKLHPQAQIAETCYYSGDFLLTIG